MHQVPTSYPIIETQGLLFHIVTLHDSIEDSPAGIAITNRYAETNPVLRKIFDNGITYQFIVLDPMMSINKDESPPLIHKATILDTKRNPELADRAPIELYVDWTVDIKETFQILENTIDQRNDPPIVTELAHKLLNDGFKYSYEFINILRREFQQFWLTPPRQTLDWHSVLYYSAPRQKWYSIIADKSFSIDHPEAIAEYKQYNQFALLKRIDFGDQEKTQSNPPVSSFSFAEEMISVAFVELSNRRTRSAIVHAIISLEAGTQTVLRSLLKTRIAGLEQENILNAISKEASLVTLARIVYTCVADASVSVNIDWKKIQELYDTRNTIIHRGRKRLPQIEVLKDQFTEIMKLVNFLESLQIGKTSSTQ